MMFKILYQKVTIHKKMFNIFLKFKFEIHKELNKLKLRFLGYSI